MAGATQPTRAMQTQCHPPSDLGDDKLDAYDQAVVCCQNIHTLAELLATADVDRLNSECVNGAGVIIAEQARSLHCALRKLC